MASRRPSLPKASEEAQRLSALLAGEIQRWPGVRLGKMFGMVSVYRNDTFFALLPASRGFEKATAGVVKLNPGGVEGAKQWEVLELSSDADLRVALDRLQEVYSKAG